MSTPRKKSLGQGITRFLTVLAIILLIYYGAQVLLRTPRQGSIQTIAHRGRLKYAPEDTMAAFRNGIAENVDWLEFDVQMTLDGVLVVIHDETVDRTTNGTGAVRDMTLEQIRTLDAGQGEKVPTFEEVVEFAKNPWNENCQFLEIDRGAHEGQPDFAVHGQRNRRLDNDLRLVFAPMIGPYLEKFYRLVCCIHLGHR